MNNYAGKTVLVAGGTGTLGVAVVNQLLRLNCNVIVASLDSTEYFHKIFPFHSLRNGHFANECP